MHSYIKFIALILLLFITKVIIAQSNEQELNTYFTDVRSGRHPAIPGSIVKAKDKPAILNMLIPYYKDTASLIRSKAYAFTKQLGAPVNDLSIRQQSVEQLIDACTDPHPDNVETILNYLKLFKKEDFSQRSKEKLRLLVNSDVTRSDDLFKIIGFLELTDQMEAIRPHTQPGSNKRDRWAALVSLVRIGDEAALQEVIGRIRKLEINDDIVGSVFPDLVYTRQKPIFDYLIEILKSDAKNCTSPGESETPITCGYRVMEQLAKAIEGYPLELDESGDIKTTNYKQALITVRAWFDANKDYRILKDTY